MNNRIPKFELKLFVYGLLLLSTYWWIPDPYSYSKHRALVEAEIAPPVHLWVLQAARYLVLYLGFIIVLLMGLYFVWKIISIIIGED